MSRAIWRLIGRFALIFVLVVVALAAIWPQIAPSYTSFVASAVRPLFHLIESPDKTVLDVQGDTLSVYRIVGEDRITPLVDFDRYTYVSAIPLLALFLATPGLGLRRRIARTLGGLVLLWIVQVFYLLFAVELVHAVLAGRAVGGWEIIVRVLWEAAPLLIWVGMTASAWKRVFKALRSEGTNLEETGRTESPNPEPMGLEG